MELCPLLFLVAVAAIGIIGGVTGCVLSLTITAEVRAIRKRLDDQTLAAKKQQEEFKLVERVVNESLGFTGRATLRSRLHDLEEWAKKLSYSDPPGLRV